MFDEEMFKALYDTALVRRIRRITKAREEVLKEWTTGDTQQLLSMYVAHYNRYALHKCEENETELEKSQIISSLLVARMLREAGYTPSGVADTWVKEKSAKSDS